MKFVTEGLDILYTKKQVQYTGLGLSGLLLEPPRPNCFAVPNTELFMSICPNDGAASATSQ